jgi:hypothetical protein
LGLNDGFHSSLPPDIAAHDCEYGRDFTVRTPQLSVAGAITFVGSLACAQTHALILIEAPDVGLAASLGKAAEGLTSIRAIENGNELELPPHELPPSAWAAAQVQMAQAERSAGWTGDIITGGVFALTRETKQAILSIAPTCRELDCMIGVHLYDPSDDDIAWLDALNLDIAVTETGAPTNCVPAKLQEQADYLRGIRARVSAIRRLRYFIVYQRPSGASCSDADTFGIQALDGTWKPADRLLIAP